MTGVPSIAPDSSDEGWRAWLVAAAALALAYALFVGRGGPGIIPYVFLTLAILASGTAVLARTPPRFVQGRRIGRLLGFGLAVQFALLLVWPLTNPLAQSDPSDYIPFWIGMGAAIVIAAAPIFGIAHTAWWRLPSLVAIHLAIGAWVILTAPDPHIDVWVMQVDAARALVDGVNPYLPIYENLHGIDSPYYGPGLVEDGELTIGFPYPPLSLLLVLPAELLAGDVRFTHLAAVGIGALVMAAIRPGPTATGAALLYLFTPWTFVLVAGAWTEPLVVLFLAFATFAAARSPRLLGIATGLLIAVKQYALVGLPIVLLLVARTLRERWRIGWQAVAFAVVVTVPFVVWGPGAFAWSAFGSLAGQIFRPDSLTFLAVLPGEWGPRLSILGFALVIGVGALAALRAPRTPMGLAGSTALLLLVFFAFSRQGSANYHVAVIGSLCCAVAAAGLARAHPGRRHA